VTAYPRTDALRDAIAARLSSWPASSIALDGRRHAAVALVICDAGLGADLPGMPRHAAWSGEAAFLLTRRSAGLNRHAAQFALPGGRIDPGETALDAALRELHEELGLPLDAGTLLGQLDDYATRSGYVITPFVFWGGSARELTPDPGEVKSAHRVPLAELQRADAPILDPPHPDNVHPVLRMPLGSHWVAAPTAAVLYQFAEVALAGRATRVAHFDQPRFTWK
jgi:8-oxo-dGTP pyrophosphatase MutT (NUDIX family)